MLSNTHLGLEANAMLEGLFIVEGNAGVIEIFYLVVFSVAQTCQGKV